MATAWQALGSQVTLLVRGGGLLANMEPFAGELVAEALRDSGVDLRLRTSVTSVIRGSGADDGLRLTLADGVELTADEILFATGRSPNTADVGWRRSVFVPGTGSPWTTPATSSRSPKAGSTRSETSITVL